MQQPFTIAAIWLALAVVSAVVAYRLRIAIALVEICVGVAVAGIAMHYGWFDRLGSNEEWLKLLASTGAVLLTFLAGAELDPAVIRTKLTEVSVVGVIGFAAPFLVCAAIAHWALGWNSQASLLAGVALSTTSMAVVYSVMLETGFNRIGFGKGILGSCFINDLGTVIALGLLFVPFTYRTIVFIAVTAAVIAALPRSARSSSWSCSSASAHSPTGPAAKPCCRPTSWASSWPVAPPRTTTGSDGCAP